MTVLKTINTKPPKNRNNAESLRVAEVGGCSLALLFSAISFTCFWNEADVDGLLYLAMALLSVISVLLGRRLLRQGPASIAVCVLLALITGTAAIWGEHTILTLMFALFLPLITAGICGIKNGMIISGCFALAAGVMFYSPILEMVPAEYPEDIRRFYPVMFVLVCVVYFVRSYFNHKQVLSKRRSEETLEKAVRAEHDKLMNMTTQTILSISNAVDARDAYTKRHSSRVAEYSVMLAKALGWDSRRLEQLYSIALLHDIGKIAISDSILNKHSSLNYEEYELIKQHTIIGGEILKDLTLLPNASIGAVSHHEYYDGSGYPYGLKGPQIPLEARIIGIADAFDAMNSSRVYRAKMAPDKIMQELENGRGHQFDPELLDLFLPIAKQILQLNER